MANVEVAEAGKYFSPHDTNIGGCLCSTCYQSVKFVGYGSPVMTGVCCGKKYTLAEEAGHKLQITEA